MQRNVFLFQVTLGALFLAGAASVRADSFTFTLEPDPGDVSGPAGSTVGWGYSITNDSSTDYLTLTGVDSDLFLATDGTPDASIFDFPVLAPLQTITEDYDPIAFVGLFQFTWNSGLPVGTTETGNFTVYAQFCDSADLSNCGDTVSESAAYTATVSPSGAVATPEPSTILLLSTALFALGIYSRRSARKSNLLAYGRHRRADGALERPATNMVDLLLHGARERHDAHRGQDQILLG